MTETAQNLSYYVNYGDPSVLKVMRASGSNY